MTYEEIARAADVSTATVSRVLAGTGRVSDERRQRVLEVVEALSYRGSRPARALRRQRADTIGLIVSDAEYPFVASVSRAVENAAAERGFALTICNTDESLSREQTYIDLMIEEKVAGVIMAPATEDPSALDPLVAAGIPVVTIDRIVRNGHADAVLLDNAAATELLVRDLLGHGHRHFAAVLGTTTATPSRERLDSLRDVLDSVPDTTLLLAGSRLGGTVGIEHTLETIGPSVVKMIAEAEDRPTAFICANAVMLMSVLEALLAEGIRVPEDAAVVGFDDMAGFSLFATPVTVVAQPTRQIGRLAVDQLFERMQEPDRPSQVTRVPPQLVVRRSCGHPLPA
jgi:DNA-binding LacI/PurR family transcriptional regulator